MPELARLALLLILLAVFWNLARGTLRPWLRAKFLGEVPTRRSSSSTPPRAVA